MVGRIGEPQGSPVPRGSPVFEPGVARPPDSKLAVGFSQRNLDHEQSRFWRYRHAPFDPEKNTHYALSEDADLELRTLFQALDAISMLADTPPGECGPEIQPMNMAPVFATFARHGQRIMAETRIRYASQIRRKSA